MSREKGFYHIVLGGEANVGQWDGGNWSIIGDPYKWNDHEFGHIGEKIEIPPIPCLLGEGMYWIKEREGSDWSIWEGFKEPEDTFAFTRRSKFVNIEDVYAVGDFIPTPED